MQFTSLNKYGTNDIYSESTIVVNEAQVANSLRSVRLPVFRHLWSMEYLIHFGTVEETHCKGTETEDIPPFVTAISPNYFGCHNYLDHLELCQLWVVTMQVSARHSCAAFLHMYAYLTSCVRCLLCHIQYLPSSTNLHSLLSIHKSRIWGSRSILFLSHTT